MPHKVRTSERLARRKCLRAWDLGYRQGWTPIVASQALEFGLAFHGALQVVYDPQAWDLTTPEQKLAKATNAFELICSEQEQNYLETTCQTRLTWDGRDDYLSRVQLGKRMLTYYVLEVHPVEDTWFRPTHVEAPFEVPLLDEHHEPLRCNNSPRCGQYHESNAEVLIVGTIDLIVQDIERGGRYWIVDWKTVGGERSIDGTEKRTSRFTSPADARIHVQLGTYCYVLRYRLELDVAGYILAEIRKDYPKPPARLRRKHNACLFSTSKEQPTTHKLFRWYVAHHDPDGLGAGVYDNYLDFLRSADAPVFHKREPVEKSLGELEQIGLNLIREVRDMLRPDQEIYPEQDRMSCKNCEFRPPCEMMQHGMPHEPALEATYRRVEPQ